MRLCAWIGSYIPNTRVPGGIVITANARSKSLDDGDVGLAAALAHRLQPVSAAGALELGEHRGHQPRAGGADRVAQRDRPAVRVDLRRVGAGLGEPREHDAGEGLVDLDDVHVL